MKPIMLAQLIEKTALCFVIATLTACAPSSTIAPVSSSERSAQSSGNSRVRKVGDVPQDGFRYRLQFLNEQEGWLADNKRLWRTSNGGASWELIYSAAAQDAMQEIEGFEFLNSQVGWMERISGLYKTEDGGRAWMRLTTPLDYPSGELRGVNFLEGGRVGWIVGGTYRRISHEELLREAYPNNAVTTYADDSNAVLEGVIYRTDDGGRTWQRQLHSTEVFRFFSLYFTSAEHGLALADYEIFYTENGGRQWDNAEFRRDCVEERFLESYERRPVAISFANANTGWLTFNDGRIAKTIDGGQTWCDLLRPEDVWREGEQNAYFKTIYFSDATHGWGLKADGSLHRTQDGGITWVRTVTDNRFDDMCFLDTRYGWVVGRQGLFRIIP